MKKKIIAFVLVIVVIGLIGIVTNYIDGARVRSGIEPKFTIKTVSYDGSKVTYWGLGYKVVRYVGVSPKEPYESNIGVKMGSWFMKYELPSDEIKEMNSIDNFYNTNLTKDKDIRNLGKLYNSFDAQKDSCFVIGAMVHNDYLYYEFMEGYKNDKSSFIRVAQNTIEGDLILYDILYDENTDKLYIVTDNTRDKFAAVEDRKIEMREFENISEYTYNNHLYWVLFNGEINDESFESNDVFVITTIN